MDFRCSYQWLRTLVDVRLSPDRLAELLSLHSVSVERMHRLDVGLTGVVLGRIIAIDRHPKADTLSVAQVDIGGRRLQVIFGQMAIVHVGDRIPVAVAPTVLPSGLDIAAKDIRGVRSEGMFCLDQELGLAPQDEPPRLRTFDASARIGTPIPELLGLDDVIFEVEVTTNRPDLMSMVGIAREVAAITGARLRSSEVSARQSLGGGGGVRGSGRRRSNSPLPTANAPISVRIADRRGCPRYGAAFMRIVKNEPSPWWMQRRLRAAGLRPLNVVVDVTNYVMLELGQPLHAFDADRLAVTRAGAAAKGIALTVRRAQDREVFRALDGNAYTLLTNDLVIADGERPVALAGIIGGTETAVGDSTTRVILEAANFDPMSIRRTSRRLTVRTDAAIRFEKGLPLERVAPALARATAILAEVAHGIAGSSREVGEQPRVLRSIRFDPAIASAQIGIPIPPRIVRRQLDRLGCRVRGTGTHWQVTPPWWRRGDLEGSHDLVEEVARLYGYHNIPAVLPGGRLPAAVLPERPATTIFGHEERIGSILSGAGATEVMTYAITAPGTVERCGYTVDRCVVLENPLSEEFALLRPALLTTLLPAIAGNQEHHPKALVFEMGNVYVPTATEGGRPQPRSTRSRRSVVLPREESRLIVASYGRMVSGGNVVQLKGVMEHLFEQLGIRTVDFRSAGACTLGGVDPASPSHGARALMPACLWHPGRTMDVFVGDVLVGVLGEVHPTVVEEAGMSQRVAACELDLAPVIAAIVPRPAPPPPPMFPSVKRDLAILVDRRTPYADVAAALAAVDSTLTTYELFDQYEGAGVPIGKKSLAFHLTFSVPDRTLTSAEVESVLERLTTHLRTQHGAEVRS